MEKAEYLLEESVSFGEQVELLGSRDKEAAATARSRLSGAGEAARGSLKEGLKHPNWRVRAQSVEILSSRIKAKQENWLQGLLADGMPGVRRAAIHALARWKREGVSWTAEITDRLIELALHDSNVRVRRVALQALGLPPREPAAREAVRTLLGTESDSRVLYNARWAFEIEDRRRIAALRSRKDRRARDEIRRQEVRERLNLEDHSSEQLVELLASADGDTASLASEILFHRGKEAMDAMLAGMMHADPGVRSGCAGLMDHLGDSRCVEPLSQALSDSHLHVRRAALHSISCRACKKAPLEGDVVGPLIERALNDPNRRVRYVATLALGSQEYDPRAIGALRNILEKSKDPVLLSRARRALEQQLSRSQIGESKIVDGSLVG